ncbi:MAG: septum formation inhibitor Maf [Deltaproteobacteria bacterium]|nr:MAG: septum formation inhibitor Maf [Deltaproteobacteria bacterium]
MSSHSIILASASPRRRELLERIGIHVKVVPAHIDETSLAGETPDEHVRRLSRAKAESVAAGQPDGRFFIGSDTVVVLDGRILGKPVDRNEAAAMLRALSGKRHQVWSGFAVHDRTRGLTLDGAVCTEVEFRTLNPQEIDGYIETGEPMDKAGAYAIQGIGTFMVRQIHGSYTNVVGLPLAELLDVLAELGAGRPFMNREQQP